MQATAFRPSPLSSPTPMAAPPHGLAQASCGFGFSAASNSELGMGLNTASGGSLGQGGVGAQGLGGDPVKASVAHLLARAHGVPCSAAAQAFGNLVVQPARFGIALDILLPALSNSGEVPKRILVAYIVYHMYASHPIDMNPFKSAFAEVFTRERDAAAAHVGGKRVSEAGRSLSPEREIKGGAAHNEGSEGREQLVWVLWKILKGDGDDLGPYTPTALASSPIPPKLRASQLTINDLFASNDDESHDLITNNRQSTPASFHHDGQATSPVHSTASPSRPMPFDSRRASPMPPTLPDHAKTEMVEQGIRLLQVGSQRVLSLSEQRVVALALPLFNPKHVMVLSSLPSLFALNPVLGHPLVVSLLGGGYTSEQAATDGQVNRGVTGLRASNSRVSGASSLSAVTVGVLDVLRYLPPTLPSFDILGRLLRDPTLVLAIDTGSQNNQVENLNQWPPNLTSNGRQNFNGTHEARGKVAVADLTRTEVLGAFVHNAIEWVHTAERQAQEGLISDDRAAKGVQSLCRFYNSLIKLGLVDAASDTDSAAMAHFALAHAHFEDAHALYRVLVMGKF